MPELELVAIASDEGAAVEQALPVDYDLVPALPVTAAQAVGVVDLEVLIAGG